MSTELEGLKRPNYPKQIILDIHSYCNAGCVICPYRFLKDKLPMGTMETGLFRKIIDDFADTSRENNFRGKVLFCNMGELFIQKTTIERMQYVIDRGLEFNIQTNGSLLSPQLTDQLIANGFEGNICISIHGISPHVYKRIMGLDIQRTLENVNYLIDRFPREKILIQAIPYEWPRGEARKVRSYWKERGIRYRMPLPNNRAGLLPDIKNEHKASLYGCNANRPLGEMVICFNGDVILCCNDMSQQEVVGNLKENTISEVWNGEKFLQKVKQIYCGEPSDRDFICRHCEFGKVSQSPIPRLIKNVKHSLIKFYTTMY